MDWRDLLDPIKYLLMLLAFMAILVLGGLLLNLLIGLTEQ